MSIMVGCDAAFRRNVGGQAVPFATPLKCAARVNSVNSNLVKMGSEPTCGYTVNGGAILGHGSGGIVRSRAA